MKRHPNPYRLTQHEINLRDIAAAERRRELVRAVEARAVQRVEWGTGNIAYICNCPFGPHHQMAFLMRDPWDRWPRFRCDKCFPRPAGTFEQHFLNTHRPALALVKETTK